MMSQAEDCEGTDDGEKNELFLFSDKQSLAEMSPARDDEPAKSSCNVSELITTSESIKQGQAKHVERLPFMESHASLFHAIHSITKSIKKFGEHDGGITLKVKKHHHIDLSTSQEEGVVKEDLDLAKDSQDLDLLNPDMVTDSQDRDLAKDSNSDSNSTKDSQDLVSEEPDLAKDSQEPDSTKDSQDLEAQDSDLTKDSQDADLAKGSQDSDLTKDSQDLDARGSDLTKDSQDADLTKVTRDPDLATDSWDPYSWVLELGKDSWDPDSWNPDFAKGSWNVDSWDPDLTKAFQDSDSGSTKGSQDPDLQDLDLTEDSQDPDLTKDSQEPDSWDPDSTQDSRDLDSAKDSQDLDLAKDLRDPDLTKDSWDSDLAKDSREAKSTSAPARSRWSKLKSKTVISRTKQKRYLIELPPAHLLPYLVLIKRVISLPISAIQKQCISGEILCRIQYFTLKLQKKKTLSWPVLAKQPTHRLPAVRETGYVTFDSLRDLQWKLYKGIAKRKPKTIGMWKKSSYSYGLEGITFAKFTEYVLPLIPKGWIVDDSLKFSENMVVLFAQNKEFH